MNISCFVGNLGKDWEIQESNGKQRAKNSMAIRKYNGESFWINLVIFNEKRIQALVNNTGKGDKLGVTTNLDINEHEGKYYHTFIINDFTFCGSKQNTQQQPNNLQQQNRGGFQAPQQQAGFNQASNATGYQNSNNHQQPQQGPPDDDIPFACNIV